MVDEDALVDGRPDGRRLAPLVRLGGDEWSTIGDVVAIPRIRYAVWPRHFSAAAGTSSPSS